MPRTHKIDELPPKDRRAVVKTIAQALTDTGGRPNYRALLAQMTEQIPSFAELSLDHTSLWRYGKQKVQPGIAQAIAEAAERQTEESRARQSQIERATDATETATQADPIRILLDTQRLRVERSIGTAMGSGQLDTHARLESVYGANIERTARAIQHPGWAATPASISNTQVVLVLPRPADVQRRIAAGRAADAVVEGTSRSESTD